MLLELSSSVLSQSESSELGGPCEEEQKCSEVGLSISALQVRFPSGPRTGVFYLLIYTFFWQASGLLIARIQTAEATAEHQTTYSEDPSLAALCTCCASSAYITGLIPPRGFLLSLWEETGS